MRLTYNIYSNGGQGGPVNYATPIGTTASLTYTIRSLPTSSDTTFAVRAMDLETGLEEANTETRVRIILDESGQDISARPNPPIALMVRATAGGGCLATWGYNSTAQAGAPTAFLVYLTAGMTANYTTPAMTIPYVVGTARFSCELSDLADGSSYTVAVRSTNNSITEGNTTAVSVVVGDSTPPGPVDGLVGVATFTYR